MAQLGQLIVCLTGVTEEEERRASSIVLQLGGSLTGTLQSGVSCLVVKTPGSTKHKAALKLDIPCVTYRWLLDSKMNGSFQPYAGYRAGTFQGLVIACTQFELEERQTLEKIIRDNGGSFERSMKQDVVTHLVAIEAKGDKYAAAIKWKIQVVSLEWIHASIKERKPVPEKDYRISLRPTAAAHAAWAAAAGGAGAATGASTSTASSTAASIRAAIFALPAPSAVSAPVAVPVPARSKSPPPPPPLPPLAPLADDLPSPACVTPDRSGLLSGDTFFLTGFAPQQRDSLVGLLCAGGAKRHIVLTPQVTKVILGAAAVEAFQAGASGANDAVANASRRLLLEIKRHPTAAQVVRLEWLVELLVPGFVRSREERRQQAELERQRQWEIERELAREAEMEIERAKEKEWEFINLQQEQQEQQLQLQQQQQSLGQMQVGGEEKENNDNILRSGFGLGLGLRVSRIEQQQPLFASTLEHVPDSQSFEHDLLRRHEMQKKEQQQQQRQQLQQQQRQGRGSRRSLGGNNAGTAAGPGGGYDASNSDNSQDTIEGLQKDQGVGGGLRRVGSLGQAGKSVSIGAIAGLKRPSRPVELDWRPAEEPQLPQVDVRTTRSKKGKGNAGGLFPDPPVEEESQAVTWHE